LDNYETWGAFSSRNPETPSERAATLLMLSYEPMFAWRLDEAIDFWSPGAEWLYGFALQRIKRVGFPR
jgi:hypothetical protein